MKVKLDLGENCMLLKQVVNAFTSLSMCISSSHSSNLRLTSHETLIPNNHFVWMKKDSYGWAFALLDPWSNFFDLCRTLSCIRCFIIMHLCIMHLFICIVFFFVFILLLCPCFVCIKIQNHIKSEKFKNLIVYARALFTCEFGLVPSY